MNDKGRITGNQTFHYLYNSTIKWIKDLFSGGSEDPPDKDHKGEVYDGLRGLYFVGVIDENFNFERWPGYEITDFETEGPQGNGEVEVTILDAEGTVLNSISPVLNFDEIKCLKKNEPKLAHVNVDLPLSEKSDRIVVKARGRVIFEESISEEVPVIEEISVNPFKGERLPLPKFGEFGAGLEIEDKSPINKELSQLIEVNWKAVVTGDRILHTDILIVGDKDEKGIIAQGLKEGPYILNLAGINREEVSIEVRVSDGIRSASKSQTVKVEKMKPHVRLIYPDTKRTITADQIFDVRAKIDYADQSNPEQHLVFFLDGKEFARGDDLVTVPSLDPGLHELTVHYQPERESVTSDKIEVQVDKRSEKQKRWKKKIESLDNQK